MKQGPYKSMILRWHRRIGLCAAVLVGILAISGIALNHSTALGLDQRHVSAPWLMRWYGPPAQGKLSAYMAEDHWLLETDGHLFLDSAMLPHGVDRLVGMVAEDGHLAIAGEKEILLLTADGELIERITALPAPVRKIGVTADANIAIADSQNNFFIAGAEMLEWRSSGADGISWSMPANPPDTVLDQHSRIYRGNGLSLERIVLDVHSGRILGSGGPWLMDAAAIMLMLLAATGIAGWWRARSGNGDADAR